MLQASSRCVLNNGVSHHISILHPASLSLSLCISLSAPEVLFWLLEHFGFPAYSSLRIFDERLAALLLLPYLALPHTCVSTPEGGSVSISLHSHKQISSSSSSQEADVKSTISCRVDCVLRVGADTCAPLSDMTGQEAVRGDHYPARPVCV